MSTSTQPWLSHYPEGIDWNGAVERRPLFETLEHTACLLYTSPSPRDGLLSRMPSSA